jgi:hypothetical protein
LEGCFALFALNNALVAVVVPTVAYRRSFGSTGKAGAQGILSDGSSQATIKNKIGSNEHGVIYLVFFQGTIVADDSRGKTAEVCEAQLLRQVGTDLDASNGEWFSRNASQSPRDPVTQKLILTLTHRIPPVQNPCR